jgi:hypothetical protein
VREGAPLPSSVPYDDLQAGLRAHVRGA